MENKNRERLKMLSLTALFAALIVVCSWISVPFNVISFTMQTFAVFFALSFLGGKYGTLAVAVYIAVGAAGLPVFSGFRGGVGALTGATGGYIFGFLLSGAVYILFTLKKKTPAFEIAGLFAGLFVVLFCISRHVKCKKHIFRFSCMRCAVYYSRLRKAFCRIFFKQKAQNAFEI